jgi:hypothetical protein
MGSRWLRTGSVVLAVAGLLLASAVAVLPAEAGIAADPASTLVANITTTFNASYATGRQGAWDAGNSSTGAPYLSTGHLRIGASGGAAGNEFGLDLFPPAGQALHAGYYAGVQTGYGNQVGHATRLVTRLLSCTTAQSCRTSLEISRSATWTPTPRER